MPISRFTPCQFFPFHRDAGEHGYSYHMIFKEEQRSFSNWINANLGGADDLAHLLPLKEDGADLYDKIGDGILLCKLINFAVPDTIDPR